MYLVDTSIWISYLRNQKNKQIENFQYILDEQLPFGITSIIYQEILQGARSKKDLNELIEYFSTQRFFHPIDEISTYEAAAGIYFDCRGKGLTIHSSIDCLIAQISLENDLTLIHNDSDYLNIKKVRPQLRLHD